MPATNGSNISVRMQVEQLLAMIFTVTPSQKWLSRFTDWHDASETAGQSHGDPWTGRTTGVPLKGEEWRGVIDPLLSEAPTRSLSTAMRQP
jgi:hypothetical protein